MNIRIGSNVVLFTQYSAKYKKSIAANPEYPLSEFRNKVININREPLSIVNGNITLNAFLPKGTPCQNTNLFKP